MATKKSEDEGRNRTLRYIVALESNPQPMRVVIAVSHPILYFCPLYSFLASDARLDLRVVFGVRSGDLPYMDRDFGLTVDFDLSADLATFSHQFLLPTDQLDEERLLPRRTVWKALDRLDPEVVVIYGFHRAISRWAWAWSRLHRCAVIYIADSEDRGSRTRSRVKKTAASLLLRSFSCVFSVGDANREFFVSRSVSARKIVDVPFSINVRRYDDFLKRRDEVRLKHRADLGLTDQFVLMTCGKLIARKRQSDLIRAAAALGRDDVFVLVAGSGEDQPRLEWLAEELGVKTIWAGFVHPRDLPGLYLASDLYAHPAEIDPHPLAISEAVYCGLPVIVSDRVGSWGPTDDVQPGRNGLVYACGDIRQLSSLIGTLLEDQELLTTFGIESSLIGQERQKRAYAGFVEELLKLG